MEDRVMVRVSLLAAAVAVLAPDHGSKDPMPRLNRPNELQWRDGPPSLPAGAKFAVLEGDPNKAGPFVFRIKVPDGYRIPVHTHPKPERVTVLQGTFKLGMGARFDTSKMETLSAGTYGTWPPGMKHYVEAKGETIVQFHGDGPWTIDYVNPADDPRQQDKPREALRQFLSWLSKGETRQAYALVAPSTKEDGDPFVKGKGLDYDSFMAEVSRQPPEKFAAYEFGERRMESKDRVRLFVHFKGGDNDETLLVREGERWYVADPIHIVR
jgi:quercetin dioxygenase-like cupin family protein